MNIVTPRHRVESRSYHLDFNRIDGDSGFSFPCDGHGVPDRAQLESAAVAALDHLLAGDPAYHPPVVRVYSNSWVEPASGRCDCGETVALAGFTNTCHCGADYNMSGQRLAPREFWGEETGEHLADILRIP